MKKELYLIRHATAEDAGNSAMLKDFDRELTSKGIMESARIGQYLKNEGVVLDSIFCSPSLRTLATAQYISERIDIGEDKIVSNENLYGGGPRGYLSTLNTVSDSENIVAIVGHNPDISFFGEYLTRDDIGGGMKKGTVLHFVFDDLKWAEISQKSGILKNRIDVKNLL